VRRTWFRAEDTISCGGYVSGEGRYSIVGFRKQIPNSSINRLVESDSLRVVLLGNLTIAGIEIHK
jgi:hypothetical protein